MRPGLPRCCGRCPSETHTLSGMLMVRMHLAWVKTRLSEHGTTRSFLTANRCHGVGVAVTVVWATSEISLWSFSNLPGQSLLLFHIYKPFIRCLCSYFCLFFHGMIPTSAAGFSQPSPRDLAGVGTVSLSFLEPGLRVSVGA